MLLKVNNLTVEYGKARAVQGISLEVSEGNFVSIIGANGAGKSSILKAICGLNQNISGEIFYKNNDLKRLQIFRIASLGVAYVPERRRLFPDMTVLENLKMGGYCRPNKALTKSLDQIYKYFPRLKERLNQRAGSLSGGEQQMLAIARGLMSKPDLLIIDEPSLGLAPVLCTKVGKILKELNEAGIAILLAEQNAHLALTLSKYVYVLTTGKIEISGKTADVSQYESVKSAYLGG